MPTISVIIPAYNAERTILETIQSVQQQSFQDFEVIVINDGSTDHTAQVVEAIGDDRIKLFSYPNAGLSLARNRGVQQCSGDYIAFLDADDLWTADKLALQHQALQQHPEAGVAYSWTCYMYEKNNTLEFHPCPPIRFEGNVYQKLLVGDFIYSGSNVLMRREAVETTGGFDPAMPQCADWDYWLRASVRWPFMAVPQYQILYRQSAQAMSAKVEGMKMAAQAALEKVYQTAPPELQQLKRQTLISFHQYCTGLYLNHQPTPEGLSQAQEHIWQAIQLQPQAILGRDMQRSIVKLCLRRILPPAIANQVLQRLSQTRTIPDPRLPRSLDHAAKS
ncbi:MAG: glycosyltransferase [Elainella sp. C42_A2020_010]|nr:glycosyltransferase [Elainella sp. C42_A2020_010]